MPGLGLKSDIGSIVSQGETARPPRQFRPARRGEDLRRPLRLRQPEDLARFEPDYWVDDLREVAG